MEGSMIMCHPQWTCLLLAITLLRIHFILFYCLVFIFFYYFCYNLTHFILFLLIIFAEWRVLSMCHHQLVNVPRPGDGILTYPFYLILLVPSFFFFFFWMVLYLLYIWIDYVSYPDKGVTWDRLGVRIPTLLISPWVPKGLVWLFLFWTLDLFFLNFFF